MCVDTPTSEKDIAVSLFLDVAAALIVIDVDVGIDKTVAPAGIPLPDTTCPTLTIEVSLMFFSVDDPETVSPYVENDGRVSPGESADVPFIPVTTAEPDVIVPFLSRVPVVFEKNKVLNPEASDPSARVLNMQISKDAFLAVAITSRGVETLKFIAKYPSQMRGFHGELIDTEPCPAGQNDVLISCLV
jgi:hypothetical protein